jgi:hypothetical protein
MDWIDEELAAQIEKSKEKKLQTQFLRAFSPEKWLELQAFGIDHFIGWLTYQDFLTRFERAYNEYKLYLEEYKLPEDVVN